MVKKFHLLLVCGLSTIMAFSTNTAGCPPPKVVKEKKPTPAQKVNISRECHQWPVRCIPSE